VLEDQRDESDKDITKMNKMIESIDLWWPAGYIECILISIRIQIFFLIAVGHIFSNWVVVNHNNIYDFLW
jgi:hypothetical protein